MWHFLVVAEVYLSKYIGLVCKIKKLPFALILYFSHQILLQNYKEFNKFVNITANNHNKDENQKSRQKQKLRHHLSQTSTRISQLPVYWTINPMLSLRYNLYLDAYITELKQEDTSDVTWSRPLVLPQKAKGNNCSLFFMPTFSRIWKVLSCVSLISSPVKCISLSIFLHTACLPTLSLFLSPTSNHILWTLVQLLEESSFYDTSHPNTYYLFGMKGRWVFHI